MKIQFEKDMDKAYLVPESKMDERFIKNKLFDKGPMVLLGNCLWETDGTVERMYFTVYTKKV